MNYLKPRTISKTRLIADAGMGKNPIELLRKAIRAEQKQKKRTFVGIDIERVSLEALLKETGLKKLPPNFIPIQADAVEMVKKMRPNSHDIIFASYLLNNLGEGKSNLLKIVEFLYHSYNAIKPTGRIILINDKSSLKSHIRLAQKLGFKTHAIELSDKQAEASLLPAVKRRSSPAKRKEYYASIGNSDEEEQARPTIIILRKPLKEGIIQRFFRKRKSNLVLRIAQNTTN